MGILRHYFWSWKLLAYLGLIRRIPGLAITRAGSVQFVPDGNMQYRVYFSAAGYLLNSDDVGKSKWGFA